jgi:hypothetical protein
MLVNTVYSIKYLVSLKFHLMPNIFNRYRKIQELLFLSLCPLSTVIASYYHQK